MFKKYKEVSNLIDELNINGKDKLKAIILSILLSIIILIGPFILIINLFIFTDYLKLLAFMITTIIYLIFLLSEIFYLNIICDNKIKGKAICYLFDSALPFIFCYGVYLFLIIKGVI